MTLPPLAADTATIVLTGNFRPVFISPKWLHEQQLFTESELKSSEFELLIPNEAAIFSAGWLRCQVNPQQIILETSEEAEFEPLRDLAADMLRAMPSTPIAQMGINRIVHFTPPSQKEWNSIGDHLVNNAAWDKVLHLPGLRVAAFWAVRTDGYGGKINIQVEPSFRFPASVFLSYNDHYDLTTGVPVPSSRLEVGQLRTENNDATADKIPIAIKILNDNWTESTRRFYDVLDTVWKQANVEQNSD